MIGVNAPGRGDGHVASFVSWHDKDEGGGNGYGISCDCGNEFGTGFGYGELHGRGRGNGGRLFISGDGFWRASGENIFASYYRDEDRPHELILCS